MQPDQDQEQQAQFGLPLRSQDTEIGNNPSTALQVTNTYTEVQALHLVQNMSVDQVQQSSSHQTEGDMDEEEHESLPVTGSNALLAPSLAINPISTLSRSRSIRDDLLDEDDLQDDGDDLGQSRSATQILQESAPIGSQSMAAPTSSLSNQQTNADQAPNAGSHTQQTMRRSTTLNSANTSNNNHDSTASFAGAADGTQMQASPSRAEQTSQLSVATGNHNNPFLNRSVSNLTSGSVQGGFHSSAIGQRVRDGAFQPMERLQSSLLLNPFQQSGAASAANANASSRPIGSDLNATHQSQSPARVTAAVAGEENNHYQQAIANANALVMDGGSISDNLNNNLNNAEMDEFSRMLADNTSQQQQLTRPLQQPSLTRAISTAPVIGGSNQASSFLVGNAAPGATNLGSGQQPIPISQQQAVSYQQQDQNRMIRSRSMYATFAQARPLGLLSGITNQRIPEPSMRRQSSYRSGVSNNVNQNMGPVQEEPNDDISVDTLSLHRQDNEVESLSPSPAARVRVMNVPGLPRASSRISNSDRYSQASGTPRAGSRAHAARGSYPPVSPNNQAAANFSPNLFAADILPNLRDRYNRQPNTPNPSGNRGYMRIRSLQPDEPQAPSDAGQAVVDAADEANYMRQIVEGSGASPNRADGVPRNASRRSLLEPLRPGEEIFSPPAHSNRPAVSIAALRSNSMMISRPPVPVERLTRTTNVIPPTASEQQDSNAAPLAVRIPPGTRINPVPHVELEQQPTASFPSSGTAALPQRSLTSTGFSIRLHPAHESPSAANMMSRVGASTHQQQNQPQSRIISTSGAQAAIVGPAIEVPQGGNRQQLQQNQAGLGADGVRSLMNRRMAIIDPTSIQQQQHLLEPANGSRPISRRSTTSMIASSGSRWQRWRQQQNQMLPMSQQRSIGGRSARATAQQQASNSQRPAGGDDSPDRLQHRIVLLQSQLSSLGAHQHQRDQLEERKADSIDDLDERILRSLTGSQVGLLPGSPSTRRANINYGVFENESDSAGSKSEEDEIDQSSQLLVNQQIDQDSILDSISNGSNENGGEDDNLSIQCIESEWSEFQPIFSWEEVDLTQELQDQNEMNPPDRQVNIRQVLDKLEKDQEVAKELGKQYGALAIVIYHRAMQYGSLFDHELFHQLDGSTRLPNRFENHQQSIKLKINFYVQRLLYAIQECFNLLLDDNELQGECAGAEKDQEKPGSEEAPKPKKLTVIQAYQFLEMINKVLPSDLEKLRRITLEKTIPNLIKLSKELEHVTQKLQSLTGHPPMEIVECNQQLRTLEKRAQQYMHELLMSKVVADFKLKFQIVSGVTSSASARHLTHDLLPFLLEMHACLPNRLTRALLLQLERVFYQLPPPASPTTTSQQSMTVNRQLGGFLVLDKEPLDIVAYYHGILSKQLSLHQSTLFKEQRPSYQEQLLSSSPNQHKRLFKRLKKQEHLLSTIQQNPSLSSTKQPTSMINTNKFKADAQSSLLKKKRELKKQRKQQKLFTVL